MDKTKSLSALTEASQALSAALADAVESNSSAVGLLAGALAEVCSQAGLEESMELLGEAMRLLLDAIVRDTGMESRDTFSDAICRVYKICKFKVKIFDIIDVYAPDNIHWVSRAGLAEVVAGECSNLQPDEAWRVLSKLVANEPVGAALVPLAEGLSEAASRMNPAEASRACAIIVRELLRRPEGLIAVPDTASSEEWKPSGLARAIAALIGYCEPGEARTISRELIQRIMADRQQSWLGFPEGRGQFDNVYERLIVDNSVLERRRRHYSSDLASLSGPLASAMIWAQPYPCRLTTQELVDLLKMPTCFGEARKIVLKHLGNTLGQKFPHDGAFVRYAREHKLDLDLTSPPKRPGNPWDQR